MESTNPADVRNEIIPQRNCHPSAEELKRMTLQIGLVGTDGIVIASDRLVNIYDERGDSTRSLRSKFEHNDRVVCCWSGDEPAMYAANFIRDLQWSEASRRYVELKECGDRGWYKYFGNSATVDRSRSMPRKVIVAFADDCTLWELDVFDYSTPSRIPDKTVAGNAQTTAKHLVNNYVHESLPVSRLITIAAHAICLTGKEDNAFIGGLEIAVIRKGEPPYFLSAERERELRSLSESIHESISRILLQPFDYRPVTVPPPD